MMCCRAGRRDAVVAAVRADSIDRRNTISLLAYRATPQPTLHCLAVILNEFISIAGHQRKHRSSIAFWTILVAQPAQA
jgi:hypothetical protein